MRARRATRVWKPDDLAAYDGALLPNTHLWIWYIKGDASRVTPATVALLDRSGARSHLFVSDISYWEVAVKAAKVKIALTVDSAVRLQRAEQAPGIRFLALSRPALLQSMRLPGAAHNDPADRMLIAAAQLHGLPLVTADRLIVEYAQAQGNTPVVDVRS